MSLTLLSALEQLARYAREEGFTEGDIHRSVAGECSHGHGRLTGRMRVVCRECERLHKKRTYLRAA